MVAKTCMIDWLTMRVPCYHRDPIDGGRVLMIEPGGAIKYDIARRLAVEGSHDNRITVRTYGLNSAGQGVSLEVSGNPTKWLQGHNLFGGFIAPTGLIELFMLHLCQYLPQLEPTDFDLVEWRRGRIEMTRIDLTLMYQLGSREDVRAWLRAAEDCAYLRHRGRGTLHKQGTLYFGKDSKRWTLKMYCKGDEIEAGKGHGLSGKIVEDETARLLSWADNKLRVELILRSKELKQRDLRWAYDWSDETGAIVLDETMRGLQMSDNKILPVSKASQLPRKLLAVYHLWLQGHDLREMYPKVTFYRHRNGLLPYGIDIAMRQPRDDKQTSNVVPLVRVLEAVPVGAPDWALGTSICPIPADLAEARRRFREQRRVA